MFAAPVVEPNNLLSRSPDNCEVENEIPSSADRSSDPQGVSRQEEDSSRRHCVRVSASDTSLSPPPSQCGQTIVPTPGLSRASNRIDGICPRPPLDLLSLAGLSALCPGEYTIEGLARAERNALRNSEWRPTCATSFDWIVLLLDAWMLVCGRVCVDNGKSYGREGRERRGIDAFDVDDIEERCLVVIETLVESDRMLPPSVVAWVAVVHVLDDYEACHGHGIRQVVSVYKQMVCNTLLPSGDAHDLDAIRVCF